MKKRLLSFVAAAAAASMALVGCSSSGDNGKAESGEEYRIAIAQLLSHPSLDQSVAGFKAALSDAGLNVKYDEQNANNDASVIASIAGNLGSSGKNDLILTVGTTISQAVSQMVKTTPILFTAVTDPVTAGLVSSLEAPGANVTGTSDANPVTEQIEMIKEIDPEVKTVGVIYNPGETNSVVQVEWVKEAAEPLGIEVKEAAAPSSADVYQAAESLDVDAIYVPTDNTVVSALDAVIQVGEAKQIPVYAAEGDSIAKGAVSTYGISYYDLGYQTGQMAVEILTEGADPADMPVETQSELLVYLNLGAAERMGVTFPESLTERAKEENITQ